MEINNLQNISEDFFAKQKWQLVVNPNALSNQCINYLSEIKYHFTQARVQFSEYLAFTSDLCRTMTADLCRQGARFFIIAGGDGTLNEAVNGIFLSGVPTNEVYVAVLPLGTGNDWCRTHHYPDYQKTLQTLHTGKFIRHDIGEITIKSDGNQPQKRYFINIAGFGFDAAVINRMSDGRKSKFFSGSSYLLKLLTTLLTYKAKSIRVQSPNFTTEERIFTMAVGICKFNGNGMKQVPMANPVNGLFDVVMIQKLPIPKVLQNVKKLYSGTHIEMREATHFQTNELIISALPPTLCEVEGEMLPVGNYHLKLLPKALNLLTFSSEWGETANDNLG